MAIKVVGLRREHTCRARLLKRKDDHDDQAATADDDNADAIPTFTTIYMSLFQSVAVLAFFYYF